MQSKIDTVWRELETVADPCIFQSGRDLSIIDLGLINEVWADKDEIYVSITLTDALCVNAGQIFVQIERIAEKLEGVSAVQVVPQSYPLWTQDRLSKKARDLFRKESETYWPANQPDNLGQGNAHDQ